MTQGIVNRTSCCTAKGRVNSIPTRDLGIPSLASAGCTRPRSRVSIRLLQTNLRTRRNPNFPAPPERCGGLVTASVEHGAQRQQNDKRGQSGDNRRQHASLVAPSPTRHDYGADNAGRRVDRLIRHMSGGLAGLSQHLLSNAAQSFRACRKVFLLAAPVVQLLQPHGIGADFQPRRLDRLLHLSPLVINATQHIRRRVGSVNMAVIVHSVLTGCTARSSVQASTNQVPT